VKNVDVRGGGIDFERVLFSSREPSETTLVYSLLVMYMKSQSSAFTRGVSRRPVVDESTGSASDGRDRRRRAFENRLVVVQSSAVKYA
jgi:hypothetical protein